MAGKDFNPKTKLESAASRELLKQRGIYEMLQERLLARITSRAEYDDVLDQAFAAMKVSYGALNKDSSSSVNLKQVVEQAVFNNADLNGKIDQVIKHQFDNANFQSFLMNIVSQSVGNSPTVVEETVAAPSSAATAACPPEPSAPGKQCVRKRRQSLNSEAAQEAEPICAGPSKISRLQRYVTPTITQPIQTTSSFQNFTHAGPNSTRFRLLENNTMRSMASVTRRVTNTIVISPQGTMTVAHQSFAASVSASMSAPMPMAAPIPMPMPMPMQYPLHFAPPPAVPTVAHSHIGIPTTPQYYMPAFIVPNFYHRPMQPGSYVPALEDN